MTVIDQISGKNGKRPKEKNKIVAGEIARKVDKKAVVELVTLLSHKDKTVQSDAIEILYETGYIDPACIAVHCNDIAALLNSRNNRLVWGAMIALSSIASVAPERVFDHFPLIQKSVGRGSVITKDAGVALYTHLAKVKKYRSAVLPLLFAELENCPIKQFPQYVEKAADAIDRTIKDDFVNLIRSRTDELRMESRLKRVRKALAAVEKV